MEQIDENLNGLFAAFVTEGDDYFIYLINSSNKRYDKLVSLTGASITDDEGVYLTGKSAKERGPLERHSAVLLEHSTLWCWGDDFVWYFLDLYDNENGALIMLSFIPPKHYKDCPEITIPILDVKGRIIEITPRNKEDLLPINIAIKNMDMKGGYHKF
jgi:hypothetical protein